MSKANILRARTIARQVTKAVTINDGDVVLLKVPAGKRLEYMKVFNSLRHHLSATGREGCVVILVNEADEIRTLPVEEMREYGWIPAPKEDKE